MKVIQIPGLDALPHAAEEMLHALGEKRVIAFFGEMGAGKTTFIKALCEVLRVSDVTSSPSFGLINEYKSSGGTTVYHFDFYRIRDIEEVYDLGYEEYLYSGSYCFLEWPEKVESLLPGDTVRVKISVNEKGGRVLQFSL
jgi:tRNA threonylcarbamoyladenosine biosynthesis protein TsaE